MRGGPEPGWQALDGAGQVKRKLGTRQADSGKADVQAASSSLTAKPRCTPGRAKSASYQRLTFGKSSSETSMALVPPRPAENREIRHRQFSRDVFHFPEAPVEHAVEAPRLVRVALEAIAPVAFGLDHAKVVHLSGHRTEAAHLPHQPFEHGHAFAQARRQEFAGLLAEIEEDRARFEDADRLLAGAVRIDDGGNAVVRADAQELGGVLLALGNIHRLHG